MIWLFVDLGISFFFFCAYFLYDAKNVYKDRSFLIGFGDVTVAGFPWEGHGKCPCPDLLRDAFFVRDFF